MGGCLGGDSQVQVDPLPNKESIAPHQQPNVPVVEPVHIANVEPKDPSLLTGINNSEIHNQVSNLSTNIPQEVSVQVHPFCKVSKVLRQIGSKLSELVYTDSQLDRVATIAVEGLVRAQTEKEPLEQKRLVERVFAGSKVKSKLREWLVEDKGLFYHDVVDMIKKQLKEDRGEELSEGSQSRIYHSIANVKQRQFPKANGQYKKRKDGQIFDQDSKKWEYVLKGVEDMDEMVRMQELAGISKSMGEQLSIVFEQLEQQTKGINQMLNETEFQDQSHTLGKEQVLTVAMVARRATDISQDGVIILITYLRRSMHQLIQQGKSIQEVQALMKQAIALLSSQYPPGKGLEDHPSDVRKVISDLEMKSQSKGQFTNRVTTLSGSSHQRTQQVRDFIIHYARLAQKNQSKFEKMISQTCLKYAVSVQTGLKLNPNRPNQKALLRIQEKIFFKSDQYAGKVSFQGKDLDQILSQQEQVYQNELGNMLKTKSQFLFSVSDMLRGKCTFTSVRDILQTVNEISQYCQNHSGFEVIQVESRFGLKIPISDVTIKIALNGEIVSELQLTLQTNAAAYNFAHIIYEINRSKIFSKCKMVDNMFKENEQRISQVINRTLLSKNFKQSNLQVHTRIRKAFGVEAKRNKTWEEAVGTAIDRNQTLKKDPDSNEMLKQEAGDLMLAVMQLQSRKLPKSRFKEIISSAFSGQQMSQISQAVILQSTFLRLNLADDLKSGYFADFWQYVQDLLNMSVPNFLQISRNSCQMHSYISDLAQLKVKNNTMVNKDAKIAYSCVTGKNRVLGYQIRLVIQLTDAMAHLEASQFSQYSEYLLSLLVNESQQSEYRNLLPSIKLRMMESYISQKKIDEQTSEEFQQLRQQLVKQQNLLVEWQVWNTALNLILNKKQQQQTVFKSYQQDYQKAVDLGKISLVDLNTPENATAHWLICTELQAILSSQKDKKQFINEAIQAHYKNIFSCGITPSLAVKFNLASVIQRYRGLQGQLSPNESLTQFVFEKHQTLMKQLDSILVVNWNNLSTVYMTWCKIGDKGCEMLSQAAWPSLSTLVISYNSIKEKGCEWLSKAQWSQLSTLDLMGNSVGEKGCQNLVKAKWQSLKAISLGRNTIGNQGCQWLSRSEWPLLTSIDLRNNTIGDKGCEWISKAQWKNLSSIILQTNEISEKGAEWLSQAAWPCLSSLVLTQNSIKDEGCGYLVKAQWPKMSSIDLRQNKIGDRGCEFLSQAAWQGLATLNLSYNLIKDKGCQSISKATWPSLTSLNVRDNKIANIGCECLCKAQWPRLSSLNLVGNVIKYEVKAVQQMCSEQRKVQILL